VHRAEHPQSASDARTRVRWPADGSSDNGGDAGHTERYSPPGPNLHTGSIHLMRYVSILDTLCIDAVCLLPYRSSFYRPPSSKNPNKNRTKSVPAGTFLRIAIPRIVPRHNMGPMTQKHARNRSPAVDARTPRLGRDTTEPHLLDCRPLAMQRFARQRSFLGNWRRLPCLFVNTNGSERRAYLTVCRMSKGDFPHRGYSSSLADDSCHIGPPRTASIHLTRWR
jgi:hypothetical protein